jgi:hypothetical protein
MLRRFLDSLFSNVVFGISLRVLASVDPQSLPFWWLPVCHEQFHVSDIILVHNQPLEHREVVVGAKKKFLFGQFFF